MNDGVPVFGSLAPYSPSWREQIGNAIHDYARMLGLPAHRMRQEGQAAMDFLPGVGEAVGLNEAWRDARAGNWGMAAAGLGATAAGAFPGVGDVAGNAIRKARGTFDLDYFGQPVKVLQNPSPQQTAGFLNRTKYKAARRIVDPDTGDTYLWDAGDPALHALVAEQLGIKQTPKTIFDMIGLD